MVQLKRLLIIPLRRSLGLPHNAHHDSIFVETRTLPPHYLQMYHSQGKPCPVAISFGHHPVFLVVGSSALPYGQSEYEYAGAILGAPIEVIERILQIRAELSSPVAGQP